MLREPTTPPNALATEVMDWLLQSNIPTIRFRTLTELLDYPSSAVADERAAIMQTGPVPALLAQQTDSGAWPNESGYYTPKYRSTHWTMLLLTELGIDGYDARFQSGVDYMLTATDGELKQPWSMTDLGLSCFWGNLLRYALHAGRREDGRVEQLIDYAVNDLRRGPCHCQYNDGYACAWGVVRSLWGLAALPPAQRTPEINVAIDQGITFLLDAYRLVDANYPTPDNGKIHTLWSKLSFPLFYQVDILFTLRVLAELNALDRPGAQPALAWLEERRQQNGLWRGGSPYRQRTWREIGDSEETNRWITLQAATILQQARAQAL